MARSTQNSPTPFQSHSTRSQHRRPPPRVILSNSDDDADESGSSEACAAVQPSARPPRFISLSDSSDDEEDGTTDTDANLMSEDEVYLQDLAQATQLKAAHLSQQLHSPGENREKLLAKLLDSAKRSDLRMKKFSEFIHPRDRQILDVPKKVHKDFEKTRAKKFLDLWNVYLDEAQKPGDQNERLLETLELFLSDLMDCFDHPREVHGWNPFAALAGLIELGALVRTPTVVQSCSRLTLGASWGLLSKTDKARIGAPVMEKLRELHQERMAEVMELLGRWSDKFPKESTCKTCDNDPWELFLLTTALSMIKEGTKYLDLETASDTSSEEGSDEEVDDMMDVDSDDDDHDDSERDDHEGQASDSESEQDTFDHSNLDPLLIDVDNNQEPPRAPRGGVKLRQRLLKNFGPNQYMLRIVSMDQFGGGDKRRNTLFKVCPRCGYRFDGEKPDVGTPAHHVLQRAILVAREQVATLQEVVDLPSS